MSRSSLKATTMPRGSILRWGPWRNRGTRRGAVGISIPLDNGLLGRLHERPDRVALLAEGRAHRHPTGTFHELIRLFERGFARPATRLLELLPEFLQAPFGYTDAEIRH